MNITLLAAGSRGDTQPFIALGLALERQGHRVRLAASETFEGFVEEHGLEFHSVRGDVETMAASPELQGALRADNPLRIATSFRRLRDVAYAMQQDFYAACEGADAVVYHPGAAIGYFAAQAHSIPSVLASPFPMTPTRAYPSLIFYDSPRLGPWANLLSHYAFERILWMASGAPVKRFWKEVLGSAPESFGIPFGRQRSRRMPTVVSGSRHVFPAPPDWSEHVHQSGYWFLDEREDWSPPESLRTFLESGPPPVYVGFGSVGGSAPAEQTTSLVVGALERAGQRGVLASGWRGMAARADFPDSVLLLESAPHSWLFPRMAAVVHHGGAGTTAAGFRAGVPSIVIPHANDQFAWGRRAHELGVGPEPIPRKKLTAAKLATAIERAQSGQIGDAAHALGERIQAERGADAAAEVISACLQEV